MLKELHNRVFKCVKSRVARWYFFKPKISIWVNFGVSTKERFGKFYGHLVHFNIIWPFGIFYGHFGTFFPFWFVVPRKNLATQVKCEKKGKTKLFSRQNFVNKQNKLSWSRF
jgi:hypothetical protein